MNPGVRCLTSHLGDVTTNFEPVPVKEYLNIPTGDLRWRI
jgi:hypothetical protein